MAEQFNPLFKIDAGQILAKLHLAGKEAAPNFIVINSGMKDEADGNTAKDPGKSLFDLTNKSGEYEVCFVTNQPFQYKEEIVLSADPSVQKAQEELSVAKEKAGDAKDKDNSKGITSQQKDETPKANEEVKKAQEDKNKAVQNATGDVKLPKDASDEDVKTAVEKANEKREANKEKNLSVWKSNAIKEMNAYFQTMTGKDAKKITEKDLVMVQFPAEYSKLSDFEVKDFKIQGMKEAELEKWRKQAAENQDKVQKVRLGFKAAFTVEVETM